MMRRKKIWERTQLTVLLVIAQFLECVLLSASTLPNTHEENLEGLQNTTSTFNQTKTSTKYEFDKINFLNNSIQQIIQSTQTAITANNTIKTVEKLKETQGNEIIFSKFNMKNDQKKKNFLSNERIEETHITTTPILITSFIDSSYNTSFSNSVKQVSNFDEHLKNTTTTPFYKIFSNETTFLRSLDRLNSNATNSSILSTSVFSPLLPPNLQRIFQYDNLEYRNISSGNEKNGIAINDTSVWNHLVNETKKHEDSDDLSNAMKPDESAKVTSTKLKPLKIPSKSTIALKNLKLETSTLRTFSNDTEMKSQNSESDVTFEASTEFSSDIDLSTSSSVNRSQDVLDKPTSPTIMTFDFLTTASHVINFVTTVNEIVVTENLENEEKAKIQTTTQMPFLSLETHISPKESHPHTAYTVATTTNGYNTSTTVNEMTLNGNSNYYEYESGSSSVNNSEKVHKNFTTFVDNNSLETVFAVHNLTTTGKEIDDIKGRNSIDFGMEIISDNTTFDTSKTIANTSALLIHKNSSQQAADIIDLSNDNDFSFDGSSSKIHNLSSVLYEISSEKLQNNLSDMMSSTSSSSISTDSASTIAPQKTTSFLEKSKYEIDNNITTVTTSGNNPIQSNVIDSIEEDSSDKNREMVATGTEKSTEIIPNNTDTTVFLSSSEQSITEASESKPVVISTQSNDIGSSMVPNIYSTTEFIESSSETETTSASMITTIDTLSTKPFDIVVPTEAVSTKNGSSVVYISTGSKINTRNTTEIDVNVVVAMAVGLIGILAILITVAFVYLMRKRHKQMSYSKRCRPVSLDAYSLDNISTYNSVRRKGTLRCSKRSYGNIAFDDPLLRHHIINAAELNKFVERRSSIHEEFRSIPQVTVRPNEVPHGCEEKNRYANVVPLPETRVILQKQNNDEKTEYINANYVRGPKDTPNYYIACQAPLQHTVADFWRMIWEQNSRVIIMATDLTENGIEKCAEYLPPSITLDNHKVFGDYQVILKNREIKDKYALSTIFLKNLLSEENREIVHFWYKWPEKGIPNDESTIIKMLLEARTYLKIYAAEEMNSSKAASSNAEYSESLSSVENEINGNISSSRNMCSTKSQGPLTVHCSPGTGRTGTIIACDMAIRSLESPKRSIDIPQIVYYIRRGRAISVQTKEQYEFIYKVADMYAAKILNTNMDS